MPDMVYVTNRTNVHLAITPETPDGGVVVLQPGLNEVPDAAAKDPFMANLVKTSAAEAKQAVTDLATAKAAEEAAGKAAQALAEAQKSILDARTKAGEEWASKKQAAMDKGLPFSDPHPDPVVQQSIVLTGEPMVYAAGGFVGKTGENAPAAPQHAPRVTPEGEHHAPARK